MIDYIEGATGVPRKTIIKVILGFTVLLMIYGVGGSFIANFIGVAYPCFMSFYSIETSSNEDDDKQWLTYWVLFGILSLIDQIGGGYVVQIVPFYWIIKLFILIWLFHP